MGRPGVRGRQRLRDPVPGRFQVDHLVPNAAFEEAGYEIPETWDDLVALTDEIRATGVTPWCVSMEHGDATGWVATDWIEDILLRTAPPETYDPGSPTRSRSMTRPCCMQPT